MSNPEVSVDGDLVFCIIEQLDQNGGILSNGIKHEATVSMDFISDSKIKNTRNYNGLEMNFDFNIQPWAWKYIKEHPDFLKNITPAESGRHNNLWG